MKKLLIVLGILVIALTVGYAYAAEKSMDMSVQNGVTIYKATFEGPLAWEYGTAEPVAGVTKPCLALENGVTIFGEVCAGPLAYEYGTGSAAGGVSPEELRMEFHNGITDFTGGSQAD